MSKKKLTIIIAACVVIAIVAVIAVTRGASIEGLVTLDDEVVADLHVQLTNANNDTNATFRETMTDKTGHFRFNAVPRGFYLVVVGTTVSGGAECRFFLPVTVEGNETVTADMKLPDEIEMGAHLTVDGIIYDCQRP